MSSLAAARADNFYYPPAWRPERGSLSRFQAQRRNGSSENSSSSRRTSEQIVRFEMPFDARCLHCEASIGRGVRFNARKSRCGAYLSTPLFAFALACPSCRGPLRVETDPARRGYRLVSGVRKRVDTADVVASASLASSSAVAGVHPIHDALDGVERLDEPLVRQQLRADPFFRLEHERADREAARERSAGLEALQALRGTHDGDNYARNADLRAAFRREKQGRQRREQEGARLGLSLELLDARAEDVAAARAVVYAGLPGRERRGRSGGDGRSGVSTSTITSAGGGAAVMQSLQPMDDEAEDKRMRCQHQHQHQNAQRKATGSRSSVSAVSATASNLKTRTTDYKVSTEDSKDCTKDANATAEDTTYHSSTDLANFSSGNRTHLSTSASISSSHRWTHAKRPDTDSFQHFGDDFGSQLHRLKMAKRAQQQHPKPPPKKRRSSAPQSTLSNSKPPLSAASASSKSLALAPAPAAKTCRVSGGVTSVEARARKLLHR